MNNPLISVIVPIYNTENNLKRTLNALSVQTLAEIEFILVDDGSTDSSGKICDEFAEKDSRFRVIHQHNGGVCSARNKGISVAQGKYIGFCDSDDVPEPDLYETLYTLIGENNCDVSMVKFAVHFADGRIDDSQTGEITVFDDRREAIKNLLTLNIDAGIYTKLISAELCHNVRFEEPRKLNEDKYYLFEIFMKAEKLCYKDVCKYNYYRYEESSSKTRFSEKYLDLPYFARKMDKKINEFYPELADYAVANNVITYLRFTQLAILLGGEKMFRDEQQRIRKYLKSVNPEICNRYLSKKMCMKWKIFKLGKLPYKLSVKLFTHM